MALIPQLHPCVGFTRERRRREIIRIAGSALNISIPVHSSLSLGIFGWLK